MSETERMVWSCSLCPLPEESERERLETLLRARELSLWDDAEALDRYLRLTGVSQAECARRLGRSQSAVANRLRLLRLPEDVAARLRSGELTERHARALLRLSDPRQQRAAAEAFLRRKMNVAEAEEYVDAMLSPRGAAAALSRERQEAVRALWGYLEELHSRVRGVSMEIRDEGDAVVLRVRVPKG